VDRKLPEKTMELKTEYEFTLPKGYIDKEGNLHRDGVMRLANAKDEIVPLSDPRVARNKAYMIIVLLARVVKRLGTMEKVHTGMVENLFAADLRYLEELYNRINEDEVAVTVKCPECGSVFEKEFSSLGE
jgi:hypothetical protein